MTSLSRNCDAASFRNSINKLEEIDILKEAAPQNIFNIINGRNDLLYKILLSVEREISTR